MTTKKTDFKKDLNGVEFLRNCVEALNNRNEFLNENKSPKELIEDYKNMLFDETEDEKHIFKFWEGRFPDANE